MGKAQEESKLAVLSGYWPLYRYNPLLKAEGKNPFILDSKEPDGSLQEFLSGEVRYASLQKTFPEESKRLTAQLEAEYKDRYEVLKRLAEVKPDEDEEKAKAAAIEAEAEEAGKADDLDVCVLPGTAEDARVDDMGEPCDDGRSGKI